MLPLPLSFVVGSELNSFLSGVNKIRLRKFCSHLFDNFLFFLYLLASCLCRKTRCKVQFDVCA